MSFRSVRNIHIILLSPIDWSLNDSKKFLVKNNIHISHIALEIDQEAKENLQLWISLTQGDTICDNLLCALDAHQYNCQIELDLSDGDVLSIKGAGCGTIHLSGTKEEPM